MILTMLQTKTWPEVKKEVLECSQNIQTEHYYYENIQHCESVYKTLGAKWEAIRNAAFANQ
jgi:hypothetical protein